MIMSDPLRANPTRMSEMKLEMERWRGVERSSLRKERRSNQEMLEILLETETMG